MDLARRFQAFEGLPPRERQIVRALIEEFSLSEDEIAKGIGIAHNTLKSRLRHAYAKLGVNTRLELYAYYHAVLSARCCCGQARHASASVEVHADGRIDADGSVRSLDLHTEVHDER